MSEAPERIERAAIWWQGKVYSVRRPGRHGDVIRVMAKASLGPEATLLQGFTTNKGRFVGRKEAIPIATKAGQIVRKTAPAEMLFTEDLW